VVNQTWTAAQIDYIRRHAATVTDENLVKDFNKMFGKNLSLDALRSKRLRMGIKKQPGRGVCKLRGYTK